MYDFEYVKPASLAEALEALKIEDSQALAGGQTLIPALKQRLAQPSRLVDILALPELQGVAVEEGELVVGAGVRHAEISNSNVVKEALRALAELALGVGDPQVRNRGSLGGALANNDPSACYPAAALALGAIIVTDRRTIQAADFFDGFYSTCLEEGELILKVRFPIPQAAAYAKFAQPASRFALTGVFVARFGDEANVAVTGASEEGVFRHRGLEDALFNSFTPEAVLAVEVSANGMIADLHATPEYRAHLVKVMTKRAVAACL